MNDNQIDATGLRKACTSDILSSEYKRQKDNLDNEMLLFKSQVKSRLQDMIDHNAGITRIDVKGTFNDIVATRLRMKEIHDRREALTNAWQEIIEFGLSN